MNAVATSNIDAITLTPRDCKRMLLDMLVKAFNIILLGAPGIGKTELVKWAVEQLKFNLLICHPQLWDPTDAKGMPALVKIGDGIDGTKAVFIPFGELQQMIDATEPLVVFLDDFGQALRSVQAALQQLILERRVNGHKISEHVRFVLCANRRQDKAGVEGMLSTIKTRGFIFCLEPTVDDYCAWAAENDIPAECCAFVRFLGLEALWAWADPRFKPTYDEGNIRTPRTVTGAFRNYKLGIPEGLEMTYAASATDQAWAVQFLAFIKTYRDLPDIDAAFASPDSFTCPPTSKTDVLWAISAAFASRASKDTAEPFFKLVGKLPRDFGAAAVKFAFNKDKKITSTKAFIKWFNQNQDIVLA